MKDSINRTFPSIAVASFSNRFDSHIICIKISKDGKNVYIKFSNLMYSSHVQQKMD